MIPKPLYESHVTSIFIKYIHPKLNFISLDYMTLPFTEIVHRLTQKEKCLVDMGDLNTKTLARRLCEVDIRKK